MKIGIVYAMDYEGKEIINNLKDKEIKEYDGLVFYKGMIGNNEVIITKSGIGKVGSSISVSYLNIHFHPDLIINSGICGGAGSLQTKDIILVDKVYYNDVDARIFGYKFGTVPGMPDYYETDKKYVEDIKKILDKNNKQYKSVNSYSGDSFILTEAQIPNRCEGDFICDMEGASIAHTCYKLNVPFVEIRFVSDILDSSNHIEDYHAFETEMSILSSSITLEIVKNI